MTIPERLRKLANELYDAETDANAELAERLAALAGEVEDLYVPADTTGEIPTNAQAVALARVMRSRPMNVSVMREPFGLPEGYIGFSFVDGYTGGIDREGRVST